jgi:hypothetical protein
MKKYFDPFAMIRPQNDRDISAMLAEAIAELRSINGHLESLVESPVDEPA